MYWGGKARRDGAQDHLPLQLLLWQHALLLLSWEPHLWQVPVLLLLKMALWGKRTLQEAGVRRPSPRPPTRSARLAHSERQNCEEELNADRASQGRRVGGAAALVFSAETIGRGGRGYLCMVGYRYASARSRGLRPTLGGTGFQSVKNECNPCLCLLPKSARAKVAAIYSYKGTNQLRNPPSARRT